MPKRHARRLGWLSVLVAGVAVLAVPAMATQASSAATSTAHTPKEAVAKPAPKPSQSHIEASAKPVPQVAAAAKKPARAACVGDRDFAALNTRVLQTELMVAALSCEERTRYNEFINSYQDVLTGRGNDLRSFFQRTGGAQGTTRMNSLITRLANDASKQSQMQADTYCQFASDLFEEVLKSPPVALTTVADKPWIRERHGYTACTTSASR